MPAYYVHVSYYSVYCSSVSGIIQVVFIIRFEVLPQTTSKLRASKIMRKASIFVGVLRLQEQPWKQMTAMAIVFDMVDC